MTEEIRKSQELGRKRVIERLATLVHGEWSEWSHDIANKEQLTDARLRRWQHMWVPYNDLPDRVKEMDRRWAKRFLSEIITIFGIQDEIFEDVKE